MILLIDNYDSFTYNLSQYLQILGAKVKVVRNDKIKLEKIKQLKPQGIVLSPGPGNPDQAGICLEVVKQLYKHFPILGVCLGHQTIGQAFGGKIIRAPRLRHGKTSSIIHDGKGVFRNLESPTIATRYHSLIVDQKSISNDLEISAQTTDGLIMGLRHKHYPIEGVQFHPESYASEDGMRMMQNFLTIVGPL